MVKMKILIVGLGLIGGSYCKAITSYTNHEVYGLNRNQKVIEDAVKCGCIIRGADTSELDLFDMVIVCLHPQPTEQFMRQYE